MLWIPARVIADESWQTSTDGVLILNSDLPAIDIEIEKNKVRERCLELYPDQEQLYEMIYESRFQRLWEQFREAAPECG